MKSRSELRDVIITVTYQSYIMEVANLKFSIDKLIDEQPDVYKNEEFVIETCKGIYENQKKISKIANKYLNNWTIDRLSKVDKAILSLGIYELLYTKTPSIVAINEAIELSKKYSDEDVTKMINACLDKIYHEELKEEKQFFFFNGIYMKKRIVYFDVLKVITCFMVIMVHVISRNWYVLDLKSNELDLYVKTLRMDF